MSEPRGECEVGECMRVRGIPVRLPEAEKRGGCSCPAGCSSTVAPVQQQQLSAQQHFDSVRDVPRAARREHGRLFAVSASRGVLRTVASSPSVGELLPAAAQRVEPTIPSIHQNFLVDPLTSVVQVSPATKMH